jgi:hypothetical protein
MNCGNNKFVTNANNATEYNNVQNIPLENNQIQNTKFATFPAGVFLPF